MAKTKMTHTVRAEILKWMYAEYDAKHLPKLEKAFAKVVGTINKILRAKYPEVDMAVLRKYNCTRQDACLKFINNDTGQVFGIDLVLRNSRNYVEVELPTLDFAELADLPGVRGCYSNDVFPVSATAQKAINEYAAFVDEWRKSRNAKFVEYGGFSLACTTLDEFNEVVLLPEDLRSRYMTGGALITISPETIAGLKKEFKKAA